MQFFLIGSPEKLLSGLFAITKWKSLRNKYRYVTHLEFYKINGCFVFVVKTY